jgi:hypothetical protein
VSRSLSPLATLVNKLIPGIRYPWLFAILTGLLAIDLVVPDPVPLLDEVVLAVLTFLVASWRTRQDDERPPPKDITPPDEESPSLPEGQIEPGDDSN